MRHLVQALCPAIVGNELVKLGILMALFGGRARSHAAAPGACTRGSIHVLICGDPGLGKSQLLQVRSLSGDAACILAFEQHMLSREGHEHCAGLVPLRLLSCGAAPMQQAHLASWQPQCMSNTRLCRQPPLQRPGACTCAGAPAALQA